MNKLLKSTVRCLVNTSTMFNTRLIMSTNLSSSIPNYQQKIYELRIYAIKPDSLANYIKLSKEQFHLRLAHSNMVGFFMMDYGGINQVLHIWEYDSYSHRAKVRAALADDQEWQQKYFQKLLGMLDSQTNSIMKLIPSWSGRLNTLITGTNKPSSYEVQFRKLHPGSMKTCLQRLEEAKLYHSVPNHIVAAWESVFGAHPAIYTLHRYANFDEREKSIIEDDSCEQLRETYKILDRCTSEMNQYGLTPTAWSNVK